ncbi:hypothetical protein PCI56_00670 [Plesiomonas shigelloides subsp. oncorhynchi]|nr:hypothetical protein [Plesiomonas shigelloides]
MVTGCQKQKSHRCMDKRSKTRINKNADLVQPVKEFQELVQGDPELSRLAAAMFTEALAQKN